MFVFECQKELLNSHEPNVVSGAADIFSHS